MAFSFTFFIYNGQRLFRLRQKLLQPESIGERLQWVIKHKTPITIFSIIFGLIGLVCSFFINPYCFIILIPMGGLSIFYVVPVFPKSPPLRELPYLKIAVIGLVWSIAIVWLPFLDAPKQITHGFDFQYLIQSTIICSIPVFFFVVAITLPFDIRDIEFDKISNLKTIPQFLGVKKAKVLSEILLVGSIFLFYNLPIGSYFYSLLVGHIITMAIIAFTSKKRKELFFAGLIEGTVLILYGCVLITALIP